MEYRQFMLLTLRVGYFSGRNENVFLTLFSKININMIIKPIINSVACCVHRTVTVRLLTIIFYITSFINYTRLHPKGP